MSLREAYKMVIKHQLVMLEEEGRWSFGTNEIEELAEQLHDNEDFIDDLKDSIEEHLEDFGENYGLF
ncbi:hypothetical protein NST63_18070 [Heyndrickxia sp. FSL W8-0496]|uniref:hypothetical protein n=1 Tax=Heyndrickxia sp. FSL W8-0496 TaxID=2954702 RepID=UPI0030FCDC6C